MASIEDGSWKGQGQNPLEWTANNPLTFKKYKIFSSLFAEATIIEGLTVRSQFGIDYSHTTGFGVSYPEYSPNLNDGTAQRSSTDGLNLQITNTINYALKLNDKHSFNFLLGHEGINYHYEDFSLIAKGQTNNKLTDISNATRVTSWNDTTDNDYGYLSFFARAEYNYDNRYMVELAARTDASSRFGKDNRWGRFWSVGFMWNMRNERFMDNVGHWLTNAQIQFSTGTSGNSAIPNYEHLALIGGGANYAGNAGVAPIQQKHRRTEVGKTLDDEPGSALRILEPPGSGPRTLQQEDHGHADGSTPVVLGQRLRIPLGQRGRHGEPGCGTHPLGER